MKRLVFICVLVSLALGVNAQANVTAMEYYVDIDPGFGGGITIPISSGNQQNFSLSIPTIGLSSGFHTLAIRAMDENGVWSLPEFKPFFISQTSTEARTNISAVEYFLDVDPGYGSGVSVAVTPSTDIDLLEQIPTSSLTPGFHTVYFRVQDASGQWSATEHEPFFISQTSTEARTNISAVEYFLDVDPGYGSGVSVAVTPSTDIDLVEQIPTSSLTPGFHTVYFRVQDASGQWSATEHEPFFISQSTTEVRTDITGVEYFLDVDPGPGNGVALAFMPDTDIDLIEQIPTSSLSLGFHTLYFRVQDASGQWSAMEHEPFYIDKNRSIQLMEYAFDTNPDNGNGTPISISPALPVIDQILSLSDASSLPLGPHDLYVRVQDDNEAWSSTDTVSFSTCDGALADFIIGTLTCTGTSVNFTDMSTSTQTGDVYRWDFDGDGLEDDNTAGDVDFVYTTPGTYSVTLTVDRLGCASSKTKMLTVLSPEIGVFSGTDNSGVAIVNMQTAAINIGNEVRGNDLIQTFAIENTGPCDLTISDISSDNAAYSINSTTISVAAGAIETFSVTLSSLNIGVFDATITVDSDDLDEPSFSFPISGAILNQLPQISYIFHLDENSDVGKRIGTIVATDSEMDPVSYSIFSGNTNSAFSIGGSTGGITVASQEALDFETTPVFNLLVEASDGNGGVSMVKVAVNLIDIADENPLGLVGLNQRLAFYPNPVYKALFVELGGESSEELDIQLFTIGGSKVLIESRIKFSKNGFLELNLENLTPGIYLLKIQDREEFVTKNILVR